MSELTKILIDLFKDAIFRPKDRFERVKRRATTALFLPLIGILGAQSIFVAIFSAIQDFQIRSNNFFFKLIGSSDDSFLTLSITIFLGFSSILGSNLYYSIQNKKTEEALEELDKAARKREAYRVLKEKFINLIEAKNAEAALAIASLILNNYKEESSEDPAFMETIANNTHIIRINNLYKSLDIDRKKELPLPNEKKRKTDNS